MLTPRAPLLAITIHPPCFTIRREHLFLTGQSGSFSLRPASSLIPNPENFSSVYHHFKFGIGWLH